jgi:hypothetical protein
MLGLGALKSWGDSVMERMARAWQDLRIEADFPRFDREARRTHGELAEQRFSTSAIDRELQRLRSKIDQECRNRFDSRRQNMVEERAAIKTAISECVETQEYLTRDYKAEFIALAHQKSGLIANKKALHFKLPMQREAVNRAYERKSSAQASLDYHAREVRSWYAKSRRTPWLFGNGGRKLPSHCLFGQSFGDLDAAKRGRDGAYKDIQAIKAEILREKEIVSGYQREIDEAQNELDKIFDRMEKVRSAQQHAITLRREGNTTRKIAARLNDLQAQASAAAANIAALEREERSFRDLRVANLGLPALEATRSAIRTERAAFLANFETDAERTKRIQLHRTSWLSQRRITSR